MRENVAEKRKSIGGLWISETVKGKKCLKGSIDGVGRVVIWKNDMKQPGEKFPDYRIYVDDYDPSKAKAQAPESTVEDLPF